MRITSDDIGTLTTFFQDSMDSGKNWLCYNTFSPLLKCDQIFSFKEFDEGLAYCYQHNSAVQSFTVVALPFINEEIQRMAKSTVLRTGAGIGYSVRFDIPELLQQHDFINELNKMDMQDYSKNLERLEKQFQGTGLKAIEMDKVQEQIELGVANFSVKVPGKFEVVIKPGEFGKDNSPAEKKGHFRTIDAVAEVHINKSNKDNYFFNSYDVTVQLPNGLERKQNFRTQVGKPITITDGNGEKKAKLINGTIAYKEAVNMLVGRTVGKEYVKVNELDPEKNYKYMSYEKLDMKSQKVNDNWKIERNFKFKLRDKLTQYAFKGASIGELEESLNRGNIQNAIYLHPNGKEIPLYIELNTDFDTLKFYDQETMKRYYPVKILEQAEKDIAQENVPVISQVVDQPTLQNGQSDTSPGNLNPNIITPVLPGANSVDSTQKDNVVKQQVGVKKNTTKKVSPAKKAGSTKKKARGIA